MISLHLPGLQRNYDIISTTYHQIPRLAPLGIIFCEMPLGGWGDLIHWFNIAIASCSKSAFVAGQISTKQNINVIQNIL